MEYNLSLAMESPSMPRLYKYIGARGGLVRGGALSAQDLIILIVLSGTYFKVIIQERHLLTSITSQKLDRGTRRPPWLFKLEILASYNTKISIARYFVHFIIILCQRPEVAHQVPSPARFSNHL